MRSRISSRIARDVAKMAYDNGFTDKEEPDDILADVRDHMYHPVYPHYA